jgi:hypothetical protein
VAHFGERPELVLEAIDALGIEVGQRFERDQAATLGIERLEHEPHAAFTQAPHDAQAPLAQGVSGVQARTAAFRHRTRNLGHLLEQRVHGVIDLGVVGLDQSVGAHEGPCAGRLS